MGLVNRTIMEQAAEARAQGAPVFVLVDVDHDPDKRHSDLGEWISSNFIAKYTIAPKVGDHSNIEPGGYMWEPCFEDHNFAVDEQIAAWRYVLESTFGVDEIDEAAYASFTKEVKVGGYLSNVAALEALFKRKRREILKGGKFEFNKVQLSEALATLFFEADKPVCRILSNIWQIANLKTATFSPATNQISWIG